MAFGVFIHRHDARYDDVPAVQYQFPKQYLSRVEQCVGDWIVYLEPSKVKDTRGYFAVAKVQEIIQDPRENDLFLAVIEPNSFLEFGNHVPFNDFEGPVERGLLNEAGKISGRAQAAVRPVSPSDFSRIVARGLDDPLLPRIDELDSVTGFAEEQTPFEMPSARERVQQITSRKVRDRNFRKTILRAYDETCAITGLKLINGGGRAEVEAAHIMSVEADGPDIVSNGLALSGTVHWMFDRGLISLNNDYEILISRQVNNADAVAGMINSDGRIRLPRHARDYPRHEYIEWHRTSCFKG
ncbi:MAG: HNH endonuclease [Pseudomonadota bacterium]|nr:HNH endonuclease [Pseudomonadota bacterium]